MLKMGVWKAFSLDKHECYVILISGLLTKIRKILWFNQPRDLQADFYLFIFGRTLHTRTLVYNPHKKIQHNSRVWKIKHSIHNESCIYVYFMLLVSFL